VNSATGESTFNSFFEALYWATITLTTVGYGDIVPTTDLGRLVSMFSSLFGLAIIALPSGIITASYLEELRSHKLEANHNYVLRNSIERITRREIPKDVPQDNQLDKLTDKSTVQQTTNPTDKPAK